MTEPPKTRFLKILKPAPSRIVSLFEISMLVNEIAIRPASFLAAQDQHTGASGRTGGRASLRLLRLVKSEIKRTR